MSVQSIPATLSLVMLILLTVTSKAQAIRGVLLLTRGEKVIDIADIPDDSPVKKQVSDARIGYRCEHVGVFWLAFWTWDGKYCIYSEEQKALHVCEPAEIAEATGVPESRIRKPLSYTFPPLLVIVVAFVVLGAFVKLAEERSEARQRRESRERTSSLRTLVGRDPPAGGEPFGDVPGGVAEASSAPAASHFDDDLLFGAWRGDDEEEPDEQPAARTSIPNDEALFDALMDALCCVMVSDRRVSKSERMHVHEVMRIVKCPWSAREIDQRMNGFVSQVKQGQYRQLYDGAYAKLERFRGRGKERLVIACLNAVARADGTVDEAEKQVLDRLMSAVSEQPVRPDLARHHES
ncbi:MAG: TerB family tellurite resistance protein [Phycisphaerae bacterium]|nr:TerB family tellurite resistance protein [Phycisphaerae bacterium]